MSPSGMLTTAAQNLATRIGVGGLSVGLVLLAVAAIPLRGDLARDGSAPMGTAARIRVGWEVQARRALASGHLPFWNPYQFGGRPFLADPRSRVLYPPRALLRVLPPRLAFPVESVLHLWLAGLGGYLIARHIKASPFASVLAAVALMLSGLRPGEDLAFATDVTQLAWLPLVAAMTLRSVERLSILPGAGLVLAVTLALTSAPPDPALVFATVGGTYTLAALWSASAASARRLLGQAIVLVVLSTGLSAFQHLPFGVPGDVVVDTPGEESWHASTPKPLQPDPALTARLASLGGGRVLSVCDRRLDASQLMMLGIPSIDGYGGSVRADLARFVSMAKGESELTSLYSGIMNAGHEPTRPDLFQFLGVEYLVACDTPDPGRWRLLSETEGVGIYRNVRSLPRAFWTCAPQQVSRGELEYHLRRARYDERLTLLSQAAPRLDGPKSEWLIGLDPCDAPRAATVTAADRFDGGMTMEVDAPRDGLVFLSETYYPERRAWVDGRAADTLKVNLTFTGVPVKAGRHRVELRYGVEIFWRRAMLSLLTLVGAIALTIVGARSRSAGT